jgi:hypothetical protein
MLAHRALFHFNCRRKRFVDAELDPAQRSVAMAELTQMPADLVQIFGEAREGIDNAARGLAGRLYVDDVVVATRDEEIVAFDHNSIDRFTGGVRNRLLFNEEAVLDGTIELRLRLLPPRDGTQHDPDALAALELAVGDLCGGRLALGAKSLGFCTGTSEWSDVTPAAGTQEKAA